MPEAAQTGALPGYREPTFGQRLVARLIDAVVALPLFAGAAALADGRVRVAIGLVAVALYEVFLVARGGQTLGKMAMSTRVVDRATGSPPGAGQAAARWLVLVAGSLVALALPSFEPVAVGYALIVVLPVLRPPLHRGLHDLAAGTIVTSTAA